DAARRGVRYEIDLRIDPAPAILAVASEIREALLNILENALAAMPDGGRLTVQIGTEADRARIAITDTGRGMSAEVQRLAFEPFFTTRGGEGGTGLGLSLAQEIVLLTGWAQEIDPAAAEDVDAILAKPFSREKLFEAIARAVPDRVKSS